MSQQGARIFIVTNQSGIARNLFTEETLNEMHQHLLDQVQQQGGEITGILYCPHHSIDHCACRKPKAGLFFELAKRYDVNLEQAYAIGDSWRDLQAATAAGCKPILVKTGNGLQTWAEYTINNDFSSHATLSVPKKLLHLGIPSLSHDQRGEVVISVFEDLKAFQEAISKGEL